MFEIQYWLDGIVDILCEVLEGGELGQGIVFVENMGVDGVCYGLLFMFVWLSVVQVSQEVYGISVVGYVWYIVFYLEVLICWDCDGECGFFDWKGSFLFMQISEEEWLVVQQWLCDVYEVVVVFEVLQWSQVLNGDLSGSFVGVVVYVVYYLGVIWQLIKVVV